MARLGRVRLIVALAALATAGATVGAVLLTRDDPVAEAGQAPPLFLDLGLREDAEADALRRGAAALREGRTDEAAAVFARYASVEARVGAAVAAWPDTLRLLAELPDDRAVVRLHRAVALALLRRDTDAQAELRAAVEVEPDTPYAVRADDFLHPELAPGLPVFVASEPLAAELAHLPAREQLAALERDRTRLGRIRYGAALQRLGRPVSARAAFDEAARAAPDDPEALAAAAVGRFTKSDPAAAFSRLGPLAQRFPRAQSVRFHLGLLLLWLGEVDEAREQLERTRAVDPQTRLGREAERFLDRLDQVGRL